MADSDGTALVGELLGDSVSDDTGGELTAADRLARAHAHVKAAGQHADLATQHLEHLEAADDGDGDGGHSDSDGGADGRAMPAASAQPQSTAQARNMAAVRGNTGAARSWRQATGRRG